MIMAPNISPILVPSCSCARSVANPGDWCSEALGHPVGGTTVAEPLLNCTCGKPTVTSTNHQQVFWYGGFHETCYFLLQSYHKMSNYIEKSQTPFLTFWSSPLAIGKAALLALPKQWRRVKWLQKRRCRGRFDIFLWKGWWQPYNF